VDVSGLIEHFGYLAILVILASAGLGLPIPQELVLLSAGVLVSHGSFELWKVFVAGLAGVLVGDSITQQLGARLGTRILERPWFQRLYTPRLARWIERRFAAHGPWVIVSAGPVPGLRAPTFLAAGIAGMPYRRFIAADVVGASISVGLMIFLGNRFGGLLPVIMKDIDEAHRLVAGGLMALALVIAAGVLMRRLRNQRRGRTAPAAAFIGALAGRRVT